LIGLDKDSLGLEANNYCCFDCFLGLLVGLEESGDGNTAKLLAALEDGNLEDEEVTNELASKLLHQFAGRFGGSTCTNKRCALVFRTAIWLCTEHPPARRSSDVRKKEGMRG